MHATTGHTFPRLFSYTSSDPTTFSAHLIPFSGRSFLTHHLLLMHSLIRERVLCKRRRTGVSRPPHNTHTEGKILLSFAARMAP